METEDKERRKRLIILWIIGLSIALVISLLSRHLAGVKKAVSPPSPPPTQVQRTPRIEIKPMEIPPPAPVKEPLQRQKVLRPRPADEEVKGQIQEGKKITY